MESRSVPRPVWVGLRLRDAKAACLPAEGQKGLAALRTSPSIVGKTRNEPPGVRKVNSSPHKSKQIVATM